MEFDLEPGTYVVAVSGGVDSMVLLHMLVQLAAKKHPRYTLVVAHFDHGIREGSVLDRRLVQATAEAYGLSFVHDEGRLGSGASEDKARRARYEFLRRVKDASGARAIITAHHQDDLLETAILNMLRGTGRRGLASLRSHSDLKRPLLDFPKASLIVYAREKGLTWHEDSTNNDLRYSRNYVRIKVLPRFSQDKRQKLLEHIKKANTLNDALDVELANYLQLHPTLHELNRRWFIMLPHAVAREVLAEWLRRHAVKDMSSKMIERLIIAAKTYKPGAQTDVDDIYVLQVHKEALALALKQ